MNKSQASIAADGSTSSLVRKRRVELDYIASNKLSGALLPVGHHLFNTAPPPPCGIVILTGETVLPNNGDETV
jgi:hypothetical protein